MRLAALISGGKDGLAALHRAASEHELEIVISITSDNPDSYMFHTYNTSLVSLQAEALNLPLVVGNTAGEKEKELLDLKNLLKKVKRSYDISGIVSGAIKSNYQRSRLEKVSQALDLKSLTPLWQTEELGYMRNLADNFEVMVVAVAAAGLDRSWLGRTIDQQAVEELNEIREDTGINLAFEGGEAETLVLDAPLFERELRIKSSSNHWDGLRGHLEVEEAFLTGKGKQRN